MGFQADGTRSLSTVQGFGWMDGGPIAWDLLICKDFSFSAYFPLSPEISLRLARFALIGLVEEE